MLELQILGGNSEVGQMNAYALRDKRTGYTLILDFGARFAGENGDSSLLRIPEMDDIDPTKTVIAVTHAHYDHWLGLKVLAQQPSWHRSTETKVAAPPFALGLIKGQLFFDEEAPKPAWQMKRITSGETVLRRGPFEVRWFDVVHSTPQSCGVEVIWRKSCREPLRIIYPGDFVPAGWTMRVTKHPDVMLLDATGALNSGHTPFEEIAWPQLEGLVSRVGDPDCQRLVVTLFSTHLKRLGHMVECARRCGLSYALLGRSLETSADIAQRCRLEETRVLSEYPPSSTEAADILFATGCQAEENSALWNMVYKWQGYPHSLFRRDLLVNASSCIPGNEKRVRQMTKRVLATGARVVLDERGVPLDGEGVERMLISPSGHATLPDLLNVARSIQPRLVVPVHGDLDHRFQLSVELGRKGFNPQMLEDSESCILS